MRDVITKPEQKSERELEGTWEEILAHAPELAGRRLRVFVLPDQAALTENGSMEIGQNLSLSLANQRLLAVLDELKRTPWSAEEMAALDGFERFNKEHPVTLDWQPKDDQ